MADSDSDERPEYVRGGSDSRANWVYPGEPGHSSYHAPEREVKPFTTLEKIGIAAIGLAVIGVGAYYSYQALWGN